MYTINRLPKRVRGEHHQNIGPIQRQQNALDARPNQDVSPLDMQRNYAIKMDIDMYQHRSTNETRKYKTKQD